MDHTAFFNRIRENSLTGAYLLCGEEEYVKDGALRALSETLDPVSRELNWSVLESAEADALLAACETLPFFAERRVVVCRALPKAEDWERISRYLPTMPPSSLLLFTVRGSASGTLGVVKALKGQDRLVEFNTLGPADAAKWVQQQAREHDVTITPQAARFLVELVGCSVCELHNEFSKAAGYAGAGQEVTREVIAKAVSRNIEYGVFAMADDFVAGKTADGLRALSNLLERESAFAIAGLMANRFKQILQARLAMDAGKDRKSVIAALGGSSYVAGKAYDAARRYGAAQLEQNVIAFSDVGYMQISGKMKDVEALEQALLHCAPLYS